MRERPRRTELIVAFAAVWITLSSRWAQAVEIDFIADIASILQQRCLECHRAEDPKGGLRLDTRDALLAGGDSGAVVAARQSNESELIRRLRSEDDSERMPQNRPPLRQEEIARIAAWIDRGANWPDDYVIETAAAARRAASASHWAFQRIRNPQLPKVVNKDWSQTSIDRFILASLETRGLTPSSPADRRTLIRRATFDLTGLPPTPEEITEFEVDRSPNAFATVVERLLASPPYGERWGRHWLDVARYADNKGYTFIEDKNFTWAYAYRDYVIRAFNEDLPYDRFLLEQLAADQLDLRDDPAALAAMGFLTVGGRFMTNLHDIIDDRIDVVTRGLMGLTVTCARCHDHKYDPIPTADYYSLYGVFRSSNEPAVEPLIAVPPDNDEYKEYDNELRTRAAKLDAYITEKHGQLVLSSRKRAADYLLAAEKARHRPSTDQFQAVALKDGLNPTMIVRWQQYLEKTAATHHPVWALWHALAGAPQDKFAEQAAERIAELSKDCRKEDRRINQLAKTALEDAVPDSLEEMAEVYGALLNRVNQKWQGLRQNAETAGQQRPVTFSDTDEEELRQVLYGDDAPPMIPRTFGWSFFALLADRKSQGEYTKLVKELHSWKTTGSIAPTRAMVLVDSETPYSPSIFLGGNQNRRGEPVPRQFLKILSGAGREPFRNGSGRLEMAQAIASASNPLTARVIANRIWLHHFGAGLVRTPSDFGLRGEPPSHPELLDYLAHEFTRGSWSIKRLHRLIMLSATYQQASIDREAPWLVDPENRLIWRMNRRRLDFESTRDAMLAVAYRLDRSMGGPAVDLFAAEPALRRTVYGVIGRLNPSPLRRAFDFPEPVATSPQRTTTVVAPQALWMMNHPFAVEIASGILRRDDIAQAAEFESRVTRLYLLLFGRRPNQEEQLMARNFLQGKSDDRNEKPADEISKEYVHALLMTNEFVMLD